MPPLRAPNMRFTPAAFEIFGRLMTVLLDHSPLGSSTAQGVHTWVRLNGGYAVGWTGGPHPTEIAAALIAAAEDDDTTTVLSPGDVVPFDMSDPGRVRLLVRGMPVELEGCETIGVEAEYALPLGI
jgi:hypothetical protein